MKIQFLSITILITLTFFSCNQTVKLEPKKESKKESKIELQPVTIQKVEEKIIIPNNVDDEFEFFLKFFNKDSVFQISRIKFPLTIMQLDDDMNDHIPKIIELKDYRKIDLTYDKSIENRDYDAYTQEVISNNNKITIEIRGIDNGILSDFEFEKIDGKWKMITWIDSST